MERRFDCTACGKCCTGWLPLTLDDALTHADRFPLFVIWSPLRQGGRSFDETARQGLTLKLKRGKKAAVRIYPASYIPPSMACSELTDDGLCRLHPNKPLRCRTMPFSAARDETDQTDLLIPKPGWLCDTSEEAAVVYQGKKVITRESFDLERHALEQDAEILVPYAEWLLESVPTLRPELMKVAMNPTGGHIVLNFTTLIPRMPKVDMYDFAAKQAPVLRTFAEKTANIPEFDEYHQRYNRYARELDRINN